MKMQKNIYFAAFLVGTIILSRVTFADSVVTWGDNQFGQLGNGTTANSSVPVDVTGLSSDVTAIAAGGEDSLAIQNGGLFSWGYNGDGQLGDGTTTELNPNPFPEPVLNMSSDVTAVASGQLAASPSRTADSTLGDTTIQDSSVSVRETIRPRR